MQQAVSSDYHSRIANSISTRVFECYNHTLTGEESILYMVAVFLQSLVVRGWLEGWEGEGGGDHIKDLETYPVITSKEDRRRERRGNLVPSFGG